jgi:hypothetical protein
MVAPVWRRYATAGRGYSSTVILNGTPRLVFPELSTKTVPTSYCPGSAVSIPFASKVCLSTTWLGPRETTSRGHTTVHNDRRAVGSEQAREGRRPGRVRVRILRDRARSSRASRGSRERCRAEAQLGQQGVARQCRVCARRLGPGVDAQVSVVEGRDEVDGSCVAILVELPLLEPKSDPTRYIPHGYAASFPLAPAELLNQQLP